MKSSHPPDARLAPTNYAASVPMTVYRELAAELRANQAVIDSLNDRNHQLLQQNQMLKQEIHNVVQATLSLGQVAGVARPAAGGQQAAPTEFPSAIAPDTLARLVHGEQPSGSQQLNPPQSYIPQSPPSGTPATPHNRVPRAISAKPAPHSHRPKSQSGPDARTAGRESAQEMAREAARASAKETAREAARETARETARDMARQIPKRQKQAAPNQQRQPQKLRTAEAKSKPAVLSQPAKQKLFTEQPNEYRSSVLDASENKEIGGIWLVLSIILIIVTAFGAGFLIMKPLLNDR